MGIPLAEQLVANGYQVKGSTTTPEKIGLLQEKGIDPYLFSLQPEPVGNLEILLQTDTLLIDIPPKAGKQGDDFHPKQIGYLTDALSKSPVKNIIYISSTSVYPELNPITSSTEVTEDYPLTPETSPASGFIQAEQLIQSLSSTGEEKGRTVAIVRCGGLIGYDRNPGKYVAGRTVNTGAVPVNYIHQDDAVGVLLALIERPIAGLFNAVTVKHPVREAVYRKSCADFGYELPTFIQPETPVPYKVVNGDKLRKATNYLFKYPDPLQFFYK